MNVSFDSFNKHTRAPANARKNTNFLTDLNGFGVTSPINFSSAITPLGQDYSAGFANAPPNIFGGGFGMANMDADFMSAGMFDMGSYLSNIDSIGKDVDAMVLAAKKEKESKAGAKDTGQKTESESTTTSRLESRRSKREARNTSKSGSPPDGTFESALAIVLKSEGGYSNDKVDRGGPSNHGVTQKTYNSWCRRNGLTTKDVKNITEQEVRDIYYNDYWLASGADKISDPKMSLALFDTAVLHGVGGAKKLYNKSDGDYDKFLQARKNRYDEIIQADPTQRKFRRGWFNRVDSLSQNSISV